jgi:hypothetical protein
MSDFWKDYKPEPTRPAPMTTERALDLALASLENWKCVYPEEWDAFDEEAITAIKQARSAPVQELPVFGPPIGIFMKMEGDETRKLYPLKQKPAPVQEPVAWDGHNLEDMCEAFDRVIEEHHQRKNPFHDPVNKDAMIALRVLRGFVPYMKLYTTPPAAQRQWVGLTDEETDNFLKAVWGREVTPKHFIQAIEAKLKERNL